MASEYIAEASIQIKAPASKVWAALTTPEQIKVYFFGTEAISDWQVGSPLIFKGVWEGKAYEDKGWILENEPGTYLKYSYWSNMSSLPDLPENYANVSYRLSESNGITTLFVTQDHIASEESKKQSEETWGYMLNTLKEMLEK